MDQGSPAFSEQERFDRLRLARSERIGPANYRRLLARFGSATEALKHLPELARRGGGTRPVRPAPVATISAEIEAAGKLGARHVLLGEPDYPAQLAAIEDPPPALVVLGAAKMPERNAVAIVGARNASANGRRIAQDLARGLAEADWCVVSGLARGIDAAAHKGAIESGTTIAVVAGGIDVIYPPENEALYRAIVERGGAILSEMPPGLRPRDIHFPRRNRIISGLSAGVIVVEAALRSGSLITARMALEQGRDVMAVPGSPLDPRCRGTNKLIREGALLVEDTEQVLEALQGIRFNPRSLTSDLKEINQAFESITETDLDNIRDEILSQLGPSPVAVDELLRQCQCSAPVLGQVLLELDLAGRLERHPGNRVALLAATS